MNNNTQTQAQIFAAAYAADMAKAMLNTIKYVRWAATAIMLIAMVVSYTHQAGYLTDIGTPVLGSWLIPGALDALTFLCVKVLGTPGMVQPAKTMALRVLVFPVLASSAINFMAPGDIVAKLVFVVAVLLIPAAELVASKIKPNFKEMDTMERDITPAPQIDEVEVARQQAIADAAAQQKALEDAAEAQRQAALAAEAQRRSEIAARAVATRRENKAKAEKIAEDKREARRQRAALRKLEEAMPTSSGQPAVILSSNDKAVLAEYMTKS